MWNIVLNSMSQGLPSGSPSRTSSLPSSEWRQSWIATQTDAFELAITCCIETGHLHRAVALLEFSKFQSAPKLRSADTTPLVDALESFMRGNAIVVGKAEELQSATCPVSDPASARTDLLRLVLRADPVIAPPMPVVGGTPAIPASREHSLPVEEHIAILGGQDCVYLTAVLLGRSYFWAVHLPTSGWSIGQVDLEESDQGYLALRGLLASLPVWLSQESDDQRQFRPRESPFLAPPDERSRRAEERMMADVGAVLLPSVLTDYLCMRRAEGSLSLPRLLISAPGILSAVPFGFLVADNSDASPERLVEMTDIQLAPSLLLLGVGDEGAGHQTHSPGNEWPIRLAGCFGAENARPPEDAQYVVDDSTPPELRKSALQKALADSPPGSHETLYLSGHHRYLELQGQLNPLASGIELAKSDGERPKPWAVLSVEDILDPSDRGFPMPQRVILCSCSTLGIVMPPTDFAGPPVPKFTALSRRRCIAASYGGMGGPRCGLPSSRSAPCRDYPFRSTGSRADN